MSRTIRRTKARNFRSRFEKDYTHRPLEEWLDVKPNHSWNSNGMPIRPLEAVEYIRAYWKYHTDNGLAIFGFENAYEQPMQEMEGQRRSRYKREIEKWLKDDQYEIIFTKPKHWWEYY